MILNKFPFFVSLVNKWNKHIQNITNVTNKLNQKPSKQKQRAHINSTQPTHNNNNTKWKTTTKQTNKSI